MSKERLTAEEILSEYVNFDNVNGNKPVRLLPLTIVDMLDEFAAQEVEAAIAETYPKEFVEWMGAECPYDYHPSQKIWMHDSDRKTGDEIYQYWLTQVKNNPQTE